MKNTWMVFGSLFLASVASADFSGNWQGSGTVTGNGQNIPCETATISLQQTAVELIVLSVDFECQGASLNQDRMVLEIQNGMDLYFRGQKVGMIMDDSIDAAFTGNGGSSTLHITKNGDQMDYSEKAVASDGTYQVTGTFKRR